eukprot:14659566-Alexandrium_andersonii.AAC.1
MAVSSASRRALKLSAPAVFEFTPPLSHGEVRWLCEGLWSINGPVPEARARLNREIQRSTH